MRILILLLFLPLTVFSQELPPIINFSPGLYDAGNQNWMISQAENKNIYVANGTGLLEYNGAEWTLYPIPGNTVVRAVKAVGNRIFTGGYMEFGFWTENEAGVLEYTSLLPKFPKPVQEGEQFWHIIKVGDFVVFQSFDNIYKYDLNSHVVSEVGSINNPVTNLFKLNKTLYFYILGKGLFTVKNGGPQLVIEENLLPKTDIAYIFGSQGKLHIIGRNGTFYVWNGDEVTPYNLELGKILKGKSVFSAINLPGGAFLIGTVEDGIYYITPQGKVKYHFNQQNGLLNNTVLSLFMDIDGNIWAGLDNGLSVINLDSPYTLFQDYHGEIGSVYASFQVGDYLYLGTNQGLYCRIGDKEEFNLIEGTNGQVWSLQQINGRLFCGHNTGTFLIEGTKAERIADRSGTWTIKKLKNKPNYYLQGHYNGISVLKMQDGRSIEFPLLNGFPYSSKFIIPEADGDIWIGNEHKGVFRIRLNDFLDGISEKEQYTLPGLSGITSSIFKFNDTLYYSTKKKILQYNRELDEFVQGSALAKLLDTIIRPTGKIIPETGTKIWGFGNDLLFSVGQGNLNGKYTLHPIYLSEELRNITNGYENIGFLKNEKYILGLAGGYLKFDRFKDPIKNPVIRINKIATAALDEAFQVSNLNSEGQFPYKTNNISFGFSVPEYKKFRSPQYSYRLLGLSSQWSTWSNIPVASFKNLSFGDYEFQVKGKVGNKTSIPVSYDFSISRPWYFSTLAIILYVLLFILLIIIVHQTYKRRHKKILEENDRALRMKNLEAEQIITKLQNEQLEREMDGKNKELAITTMSLIKKNEFLSNIKEKLESTSQSPEVKSVIRTIERDISEKDNWTFFKQAFNNADKDFFKKIKARHPELTSNDLKLCAYLRLNLSSKEIAPLLNISVKSVEIKRYRLRKKMDLNRETNLTDHIIEI